MIRLVAIILIFIPGIVAAVGIKLMRDTLFDEFYPIFIHSAVQFAVGLLLFLGGLAFLGGFVVHRDRKKQLEKKEEKELH